jgi:ferrous iron transport protein B
MTVVLWVLSSFPVPPEGYTEPAIEYSLAGRIGQALAFIFEPIGFNWQISIALVPAMGAREVAVAALATVYAVGDAGDEAGSALAPLLAQDWSMATALALMAWFVFAPQCLSTLATIKRETGGWKWALITAGYLFVLAYVAALITYRVALAFGL